MNRDIKDLLGAAIGDEPPMGIDRGAVFEAGRKRLRRRRLIQSGSVVAAVVVAAVGAVTLTGLNPTSAPGPSMPPAASRTGSPVRTSPELPTATQEGAPPSAPVTTAKGRQSDLLTSQLYAVLSANSVDTDTSLPAFQHKGGHYYFVADVRRPAGTGALQVTVDFDHPRDQALCSDLPAKIDGCTTQVVDGVAVVYGDFQDATGERGVAAVAVLPGRVIATATATNYSAWARKKNKAPAGSPVFTKDELASMLVRAGFHAG